MRLVHPPIAQDLKRCPRPCLRWPPRVVIAGTAVTGTGSTAEHADAAAAAAAAADDEDDDAATVTAPRCAPPCALPEAPWRPRGSCGRAPTPLTLMPAPTALPPPSVLPASVIAPSAALASVPISVALSSPMPVSAAVALSCGGEGGGGEGGARGGSGGD